VLLCVCQALWKKYSESRGKKSNPFPGSINHMKNGILVCAQCRKYFDKPEKDVTIDEVIILL